MKRHTLSLALAGVMLAAASFSANAAILFTNLGTGTAPASLGGHPLTPFDLAPQTAIPDSYSTLIYSIPGAPGGGSISVPEGVSKATATVSWNSSWAHGYTGPVYYSPGDSRTLTLPAGTKAFYLYTQPNLYGTYNMTVATNSGATSGPVAVSIGPVGGPDGATGFAFHTTAGESITSITITSVGTAGFAFGEFGINTGPTTTCASEGYTGTKLEWCKNICERGYTGSTLNMWIRRWIDRYRTLPYCAVN